MCELTMPTPRCFLLAIKVSAIHGGTIKWKKEKMGRMEKLFGQLEGIKAWFYTPAMSTGFFQPKPFLLLIDILQTDNPKTISGLEL